jgi:16S rRNA (guanine966-N2)-methyltransferase
MFSMLASMDALEGATVVDLFAGSGALGIEALSRGAAEATFVDHDPSALAAVRANLAVLEPASGPSRLIRADALVYAAGALPADLVLADPPYAFDQWAPLFERLAGWAGLLVAESGAERDPGPGWETVKMKRYGATVVLVAHPVIPPRALAQPEGDM